MLSTARSVLQENRHFFRKNSLQHSQSSHTDRLARNPCQPHHTGGDIFLTSRHRGYHRRFDGREKIQSYLTRNHDRSLRARHCHRGSGKSWYSSSSWSTWRSSYTNHEPQQGGCCWFCLLVSGRSSRAHSIRTGDVHCYAPKRALLLRITPICSTSSASRRRCGNATWSRSAPAGQSPRFVGP